MKHAQSYTLDIIVALSIMVLLLTFLTSFTFWNHDSYVDDDANLLAAMLFSPYPESWNTTTVVMPGFVRNHRLDEGLLDNFSSLSSSDVISLVGIRNEYFINITTQTTTVRELGLPPPISAKNIHTIKRLAAFNDTIVTIEVIVWE